MDKKKKNSKVLLIQAVIVVVALLWGAIMSNYSSNGILASLTPYLMSAMVLAASEMTYLSIVLWRRAKSTATKIWLVMMLLVAIIIWFITISSTIHDINYYG